MVGPVRGDKKARAALCNFKKWYDHGLAQIGHPWYQCTLETSPLGIARRRAPHSMLYFLIVVLQRMVHQFWGTATRNAYVQMCEAANGKCPPAVIGLLFYHECPNLSPQINVAMPDTKKQRIHDSESARAAAQSAPSSASAEAKAAADAADSKAKYDAFWEKFAENVMTHLVWPAVWAGHIRAAPKASIDNPKWWVEGIAPILEHDDVYQLYYKGGKRKAKACWGHVCRELASHNFAEQEAPEPFTQKTALEFIEAAGYRKAGASQQNAATEPKLATTSKAASVVCTTSKAASVVVLQSRHQ